MVWVPYCATKGGRFADFDYYGLKTDPWIIIELTSYL